MSEYVYTIRSESGEALYVGMTGRLAQRIAQHAATKPWFTPSVAIEIEELPDRASAAAMEARLIRELQPTYNIALKSSRNQPAAQLTEQFLARLASLPMREHAIAAAVGVSVDEYRLTVAGRGEPSIAFLAGAVTAGLATSFADVAEAVPERAA